MRERTGPPSEMGDRADAAVYRSADSPKKAAKRPSQQGSGALAHGGAFAQDPPIGVLRARPRASHTVRAAALRHKTGMEQVWFIAGLSELLVAQDDLSIVRMHTPPGDQPPLHVHHDEDECFYVLDGEITLWVGDEEPVLVRPGESARAPRGVPHTY